MQRKPLFDTVRTMLGRGFKPAEIRKLDRALDCSAGDQAACNALSPQRIGTEGLSLIKLFEGCAKRRGDGLYEAYPDPATGADPWTIGWGATGQWGGGRIRRGTIWSKQQCDARLEEDLRRYGAEVAFAVQDAPTSQQQFDALVCFHYNTGAIAKATLTRKHKAGDFAGAAREFDRWCRAGGRIVKGLVRRRAAEAELYRKGH